MRQIINTSQEDSAFGRGVLRRRFGVIEMRDGALHQIRFRPWPKISSRVGAWCFGKVRHHWSGDRCWLYYGQPWGSPSFLSVTYVAGSREASYATVLGATAVLEEIARLKQTDAIVCQVANGRVSDRLLRRQGWTPHLPGSSSRHYIKRFYGSYPPSRLPELTAAWSGAAARRAESGVPLAGDLKAT